MVSKKERDSQIEDFFREEYRNLYRYAYQFVGNADDAMEVVQDTFLDFYRHACKETSCQCDRALLFFMAKNHAIDVLRRTRTRITYQQEMSEGKLVPLNSSSPRTPEDLLLEQERKRCVRQALDQLSKKEQECLALRRWGLSYQEVAETMHMNSQSVGQVITRALRKFRGVYAQIREDKNQTAKFRTAGRR
jgi:RNA polymerase sigma factor (sigma-70 family)